MAVVTLFHPANMSLISDDFVSGDSSVTEIIKNFTGGSLYLYGGPVVFSEFFGEGIMTLALVDTSDERASPDFMITNFAVNVANISPTPLEDITQILSGSDMITGSNGTDVLLGFAGNDTFLLSGGTDTYNGGANIDTVSYAGASAGLFAGIEDAAFNTGAAAGDTYIDIENLIGTAFNDTLYGNDLVNRLSGGNGNDRLVGKGGGDTFDGGAGSDTVSYDAEPMGLRADLLLPATNTGDAFGDVYIGIENLDGSSFNDSLFGNGAVNVLRGNSFPTLASGNDTLDGRGGNDHLFGYDGNDRLIGGPGNDRMFGGLGADRFIFNAALSTATNLDTVGDFTVNIDEFELENGIFTALGAAGALNPNLFWKSATGLAHDANDRIVYNTVTGVLTYDANGNAAGGTTTIAVLSNKAAITAADFTVI